MNIGEAARASGVSAKMIRYYEETGLIPAAARTDSGYRAYTPADVHRLQFVRRARDLGLTLDQVRELLRLADERGRSCDAVDRVAREHLGEVERKIADLEALRRELQGLIGQCRHGTVNECRIIEALSPAEALNTP